ncbi:MAG: NAD-dependent protein deacylase [Eggerthellaceae bacterium]|nr:NAD-dependent protein deacylase [Eggerthellaceae bacterium]
MPADGADTLREWIRECPSRGMVFFGGAGVSTESGIPDFRSADGLYNQKSAYPYPPETMISRTFFDAHPAEFYDYYFNEMLPRGAKPNQAHRKLAELEHEGTCAAVITQNIDGLHQAAGSRNVLELHGSVHRNHCNACGKPFNLEGMLKARDASDTGVPHCECEGIIKPDVVLYEEPLDQQVMLSAINAIRQADLLLVAGTSLAVYPAAGLLEHFRGSHLAIANRDPTPADRSADLCIRGSIGEVLDF